MTSRISTGDSTGEGTVMFEWPGWEWHRSGLRAAFLDALGYPFFEETQNPAYRMFLQQS